MTLTVIKNKFIYVLLFLSSIETGWTVERTLTTPTDRVLSDTVGASQIIQMFFGLFLIIALIIGLAWLVKRMNNSQGSMNGVLKLLSMISVGQREKVALIQVGKQQLLIGVASGKVNTLLILDENIENSDKKNIRSNFSEKLSAVLKNRMGES